MKRTITLLALLFSAVSLGHAQTTTTFTFNGSSSNPTMVGTQMCVNILSQDGTVFAQPYLPNPWTGYDLCVVPYGFTNLTLDSILTPGLPNNGDLAGCEPLTYMAKVWGTRQDGTTMDGTQLGDSFVWPANTTCPYYGNVNLHLNLNFAYQEGQTRVCSGRYCHYVPAIVPVFKGGNGTVMY